MVGVSPRAWQDYESGKSAPKAQIVARLCEAGFDANWLVTGQGPMTRQPVTGGGTGPLSVAGGLESPAEGIRISVRSGDDDWFVDRIGDESGKYLLWRMSGDSMEPLLRDGDALLLQSQSSGALYEGIYGLMTDDDSPPLVRRLQRLGGNTVRASCDNPVYVPFEFTPGEAIRIVGRVVWVGKRL